jgi:hypothetical protein
MPCIKKNIRTTFSFFLRERKGDVIAEFQLMSMKYKLFLSILELVVKEPLTIILRLRQC